MPDPIWWSKYDKAKKALEALPEPLPFLVFCQKRLVMIGSHDYVMFCAGMLMDRLREAFVKISATHPHYQSVVDALERLAVGFATVNAAIAEADEKNKNLVETEEKAQGGETPSADA